MTRYEVYANQPDPDRDGRQAEEAERAAERAYQHECHNDERPTMPLQDYNDHTRMSREQLRARIEQMEATNARDTIEPSKRYRPMETTRRNDKIKRYREELDRRILADQADAARNQANASEEPATGHTAIQEHETPDAGKALPEFRYRPPTPIIHPPAADHQADADARETIARSQATRGKIKAELADSATPAKAHAAQAMQAAEAIVDRSKTDLQQTAEDLVRRYGCGSALDAIWEASHRLFHPNKEARRA